jgi:transcriptional regulator with XRE-family HTH domain
MNKVHTSVRLKEIMKEKNLKQADILRLASPYCIKYDERLGKNDLSQYVSGKTEPSQRKLFILGKALGVNPSWLMGLDVSKDIHSHANEDALSDIFIRLRSDSKFLEAAQILYELNNEQLDAVITMLSTFK